jgi:TonB-dependent starch-binding outer membrane protein SusC
MFFTQMLRVVRLTALLLLGFTLHLSAKVVSQTVTYSGTNVPLKQLFSVIKQQTGVAVFYDEALLEHTTPVDVQATETPLLKFLQTILNDQPLTYTIKGETIFISGKSPSGALKYPAISPPPPITGIVRGPDGQPIAGANVQVKGTNKGVVTDANGRFTIEVENGKTLVISNVGYATRELRIDGDNLVVDLQISTSKLDEVQIIAYGQTSQRFNVGNTATVKAEDIQKQPVQNPLLALQGRMPGLFITQANGIPGSGVTVRIQGQNSINYGNDPLYVVDGVPIVPQLPSGQGSVRGASGPTQFGYPTYGNPLTYINPADIESIDLLKDASATSIYGSRAANGVILITTKKGKAGEMRFDIDVQNGISSAKTGAKLLNTQQYVQMRKEAFKNDGLPLPSIVLDQSDFNYDINGFLGYNKIY